ncbi:uncharacterized protein [Ranitomeya imitator]|uniref:uncharacterized protein n=1 Tax=Ranitomeya imitator TaxID=111125 RepID=UPI0037E7C804
MVASIQERGPLWDSRDPRHADQGVLRRLWIEVAQSLWDGFDSASPTGKASFLKQLKTRWRSMKDRFKRGLKKEGQIRSGAAASRTIYKYNRILQFLRPVLESRETHSSTRETVRPSGAVLREAPSEPSQPSHSESRSAPPQSGEPAAGPSDVPLAEASVAPSFGSSRQRQRASDRAILPKFLHLSTVFQNGFKALCDKMFNIDRRLETIESELSRPAKHFFIAIQKGMVEHLTPELQISVMQACNNAYVTALQQARVMQSATTMPAVPSLAAMAPTPAAEHHHRAPRAEGHRHHRTEPQTSAPARPSRAHRWEANPHPEGERRKKKKKTTSTTTSAMAAPKTSTQSTQPGSTGWIDVGIPSSVIEYAASSPSSSSSVSSTHTKSGGYQSPLIADIDTP